MPFIYFFTSFSFLAGQPKTEKSLLIYNRGLWPCIWCQRDTQTDKQAVKCSKKKGRARTSKTPSWLCGTPQGGLVLMGLPLHLPARHLAASILSPDLGRSEGRRSFFVCVWGNGSLLTLPQFGMEIVHSLAAHLTGQTGNRSPTISGIDPSPGNSPIQLIIFVASGK